MDRASCGTAWRQAACRHRHHRQFGAFHRQWPRDAGGDPVGYSGTTARPGADHRRQRRIQGRHRRGHRHLHQRRDRRAAARRHRYGGRKFRKFRRQRPADAPGRGQRVAQRAGHRCYRTPGGNAAPADRRLSPDRRQPWLGGDGHQRPACRRHRQPCRVAVDHSARRQCHTCDRPQCFGHALPDQCPHRRRIPRRQRPGHHQRLALPQ